jgi:hypothetical protein
MTDDIDWEQLSNEWFERLAVYMEKTKRLETEIESLVAQRFLWRDIVISLTRIPMGVIENTDGEKMVVSRSSDWCELIDKYKHMIGQIDDDE